MKFYSNSLQGEHDSGNTLEVYQRLEDILDILNSKKQLITVYSHNYKELLDGIGNDNIEYIMNMINKIKNKRLDKCKQCMNKVSFNSKLNTIRCNTCKKNNLTSKDLYGYLNGKYGDTSINYNTIPILENMLSTINRSLKDNIKLTSIIDDFMLVTRPPGHHSSINSVTGFCYLNWTYIISQYLNNNLNLNHKVCILDLDLHHGNGTEALIKNKSNTLFIDFHYYNGVFYPRTGDENKFVANNIFNVNMPLRSKDIDYLENINKKFNIISTFSPDVFIISMGCDIVTGDHFDIMDCSTMFYKTVYDLLKNTFNKPIIIVLEGGYNKDNITNSVLQFCE